MIIDFHTHCFPDDIAERTMSKLKQSAPKKPFLDGTLSDLLRSMDISEIDISVVLMISTKSGQEDNILKYCEKIRNERIIPFPSVHYSNNNYKSIIREIKKSGFKGIKLHPQYQNFDANAEFMFPIYEEICNQDLILLLHAGYDSAYPNNLQASPQKIAEVIDKFKDLKIVLAHLGGYRDWKEVEIYIASKNVYFDISFSMVDYNKNLYNILNKHNNNRIVFGTDSPWNGQPETINLLKNLEIDDDYKEKILYKNAKELLNI